MNKITNLPTTRDEWLVLLTRAQTDKQVLLVPYCERTHPLAETDLYIAPLDECIPLIEEYSDPSATCFKSYNRRVLQILIDFVDTTRNIHTDVSEFIFDKLYGYRKLTHEDLCLPQNTPAAEYIPSNRPILSEVYNRPVGVHQIAVNSCFAIHEGSLKIISVPRWRTMNLTIRSHKAKEYNLPTKDYNLGLDDDLLPAICNEDRSTYTIKLPHGITGSQIRRQTIMEFECEITGKTLVYANGLIVKDDAFYHDGNYYPDWQGIEYNGKRYISVKHYANDNHKVVDDIRSYHRTPDVYINRSPHHPQSAQASMLRKYTIGFEVEKLESCPTNGRMPRSELFRGWEYDGSCGIEGITNVYTLDNLTTFKRHCESAGFELSLGISRACGGHINIGCENPTNITKAHLRPLSGLLYAIYKNRLNSSYCCADKRLTEVSPDRYCVIRQKRNDITELRLADAYKNADELIKAFELMKQVVSIADVIKTKYARRNSQPQYLPSMDWYQHIRETPRYKRSGDYEYLDKFYRSLNIPAYHANFNGAGAQIPPVSLSSTDIWTMDWLYLLIDTLTPWFNTYYDNQQRKNIIRDAYAFNHYVLNNNSNEYSTKSIQRYI